MWASIGRAAPVSLLLAGLAPLVLAPLVLAPQALAQEGMEDAEPLFDTQASLSLAPVLADGGSPEAPGPGSFLASGRLGISRSDTFDNGLTLTLKGALRFERDARSRPAFAGVLGACPAANAACPRVAAGVGFLSPVSPATGLSAGGDPVDEKGFVAIDAASVTLEGPWGEGGIGYDAGAATRLDARAPQVLERVSVISAGLDPTGLSLARARNDVTGASPRATYLSPRWLGLRVGASFTPRIEERSADIDPGFAGPGRISAQLGQVWEGALSFARQFADEDVRIRAALTYLTARSEAGVAAFGRYEAWGAGLEVEHQGFTGGVRWVASNNAWAAGTGDYEAVELGLVHEAEDWRFGAEAGLSRDRLNGIEGTSWLVGATRHISPTLDVGLAYARSDADLPVGLSAARSLTNAKNNGLVIELTVRN